MSAAAAKAKVQPHGASHPQRAQSEAEQALALQAEIDAREPTAAVGGAELAGAQLARDELTASAATGDRYARVGERTLSGDTAKSREIEAQDAADADAE